MLDRSERRLTALGSEARPEAPTAAYCERRSSWALTDQGINSQSRQAQSVLNCVQKPLASIAARIFAARQHNLAHGQVGASCLSPRKR